jgi:hypothetical protein
LKQPRKEPRIRKRPRERRPPLTWDSFLKLDRSAVLIGILFFCLIHWAIRVFIAPVYTVEEAEQVLMAQSIQLGYEARQPPMLAWMTALAGKAMGLSPPVVFGVKYFLMWVGLSFYYLAARNVLQRPGVSAAAVAAWALTYLAGWAMHEDLLGGVALMAALSLTLHAVTRILTWRRERDWLYLGLSIGFGLLTHHLYVIFLVAIFASILTSPFFRGAVNPVRVIFALLVAAGVYGVYAFWIFTHTGEVQRVAGEFAATWIDNPAWPLRVQSGAVSLASGLIEFTLPMSLFWLMLFWELWLPILYPVFPRRSTDEEQHEAAWRRLFARATIIALCMYGLGLVIGVETFRVHWLLPVMFTAPIWMFSHVKRAGEFPIAIRAFAALAGMFILLAIGARFVEWRTDINRCTTCRAYTPFKAWAADLEAKGFRIQPGAFSPGTIVSADRFLGGNLKAVFPKARVLDASITPTAFPASTSSGFCLAVWIGQPKMPDELFAYLKTELHADPHDQGPEDMARGTLLLSDRETRMFFQFVPKSDLCR